ncbi:MAG TPA: hypothetical protein VK843_20100 [Planctomycetota bacterium]|nr:hypothetical protein [Planctomycetota bacterium]
MQPRAIEKSAPTEPLLGPWSLTAFAVLLVIGGILALLSSASPVGAEAKGGAGLQATGRTSHAR